MNQSRRKLIASLVSDLDAIRDKISDISAGIQAVLEEEQEAYDAMPESFQNGDRGQAAQEAIQALEDASSDADAMCEAADNIQSQLEAASA